jgi:flagellar hook-associated protein FlgK
MTFSGYWSDIQRNVGTEVASSEFQADFQDTLMNELESQRQNVSGVSIDEEMVDLLKYQQLYQAAAKLIQSTANMLQTAIDMVP